MYTADQTELHGASIQHVYWCDLRAIVIYSKKVHESSCKLGMCRKPKFGLDLVFKKPKRSKTLDIRSDGFSIIIIINEKNLTV